MAPSNLPPYAPQEVSEVSTLVKGLEQSTKKQGGGKHGGAHSKKTSFDVAGTKFKVDSWRFQEWDYKRRDLPTYARGLFTYRRKSGEPEIAVRGYDKFFNVGEVNETYWENIKSQTQGPYELSVKENGCIIFLAGLEGDHLLVCSKHSTGPRSDVEVSHADAGSKWVDRHLSAIGKTRIDLARELRRRNVTAVGELCDDDFEEHVLAYDPKDAGLYLHGLNLNLPEFATYPGTLVHQFADEWGFKKAQYLIKDDVPSMKKFLDECAETGSYDGRDTEGFVIRCSRKAGTGDIPYQNWFFKFKFEEPYLMYRQWREATKAVIAGKAPKYKKHKAITDDYLLYARRQFAKDGSLGRAYNQNHGIIAMREGFLHERGVKGSDIIQQEREQDDTSGQITRNLILLPVATIGCGKTTVAIALTKLFEWGHVQNDNITGKNNRPLQFTTQLRNTLATHQVTIGDRNNHQKRERKQIIDDMLRSVPDAHFVALHYVHHPKTQMLPSIRDITQERIFARGDNHQTIQAGTKARSEIIGIMEGFLRRFEPIDPDIAPDNAFDEIIDLDVTASSRTNLETVVSALHAKFPSLVRQMPTPEEMDEAIAYATNDYRPDLKHDLSFKSKNKDLASRATSSPVQQNGHSLPTKPPKLEYFCVRLPTEQVLSILDGAFQPLPAEKAKMYRQLQQLRHVQPAFHVTLMHRASMAGNETLWSDLTTRHSEAVSESAKTSGKPNFDPVLGKCRVRLERVIWDDRLMCIVARILDEGWETCNAIPHVTVGTASVGIKPKESNDLLQKWHETGTVDGVTELDIGSHVELFGTVRAITQGKR